MDSRTSSTSLLAATLAKLDPVPTVFLSGSAIGYYGDSGDETITESTAPGTGFLADLCKRWEASTASAAEAGIRVCHLRTGLVLSAEVACWASCCRCTDSGSAARSAPGGNGKAGSRSRTRSVPSGSC